MKILKTEQFIQENTEINTTTNVELENNKNSLVEDVKKYLLDIFGEPICIRDAMEYKKHLYVLDFKLSEEAKNQFNAYLENFAKVVSVVSSEIRPLKDCMRKKYNIFATLGPRNESIDFYMKTETDKIRERVFLSVKLGHRQELCVEVVNYSDVYDLKFYEYGGNIIKCRFA